MKRAAIYLRVSSDEQTHENQRPDIERVISTRGYKLAVAYEEHPSAAKTRPAFARMMADAPAASTLPRRLASTVSQTQQHRNAAYPAALECSLYGFDDTARSYALLRRRVINEIFNFMCIYFYGRGAR